MLWLEEHYQYSMWALDTGEDTLKMVCPMDPRGRIVLPRKGSYQLATSLRLGKEIVIAETNGTLVTRSSLVIEL